MNCLIDKTINHYSHRGKGAEVIRRYIQMKYRINIDIQALKTRLQNLHPKGKELELV